MAEIEIVILAGHCQGAFSSHLVGIHDIDLVDEHGPELLPGKTVKLDGGSVGFENAARFGLHQQHHGAVFHEDGTELQFVFF